MLSQPHPCTKAPSIWPMSIAFHFPSEQYDDDDDDDDDEWLWFNMNLLICGYDDCEKKFKVV
jgi:hypothetical protein